MLIGHFCREHAWCHAVAARASNTPDAVSQSRPTTRGEIGLNTRSYFGCGAGLAEAREAGT